MTDITLTHQFTRSTLLTSNQRLHWAVANKRKVAIRDVFTVLARQHPQIRGRARVEAVLEFPDRRRRDRMNWWPTIKAATDGLVIGGLLVDDSDEWIDGPLIRIAPDPGYSGMVTVTMIVTPT